jgi:hypothetical protein
MSEREPGEKPKRQKLRLKFADGVVEGNYVNLAITTHSPTEFVLDFAFVPPGMAEARVLDRVIMNPVNAKRLAQVLAENLRRYEQRFGEIDTKKGGPEPTLH